MRRANRTSSLVLRRCHGAAPSQNRTAEGIQRNKESEDQLRALINTIPRSYGLLARWFRRFLQPALPGLCRPLRRTGNRLGLTVSLHPDDQDSVTDFRRAVLDSGKPGEMEARLRRFDGEYRWFLFRVNPVHDESGKVVKWYGTNADIEDRRRAEEACGPESRI